MQRGLGRRYSEDPRDRQFLMEAVRQPLEAAPQRSFRYWNPLGWWGDQGARPWCVAYAWLHWLEDGPVTQPLTEHAGTEPLIDPRELYCQSQSVDEWFGDCRNSRYDGTSVRAGAKVLQARGLIGTYRWAWNAEAVIQSVLNDGPVVLGTWWYERMFYPDAAGYVKAEGRPVGGHAYIVNGVRLEKGLTIAEAVARNAGIVRYKNSWGRTWGRRGYFYSDLATLDRLVREDGEACIATEIRREAA